jgi:hypothetical protein
MNEPSVPKTGGIGFTMSDNEQAQEAELAELAADVAIIAAEIVEKGMESMAHEGPEK